MNKLAILPKIMAALVLTAYTSAVMAQAGSLSLVSPALASLGPSGGGHFQYDGSPVGLDQVPASLLEVPDSVANLVWVELEKGQLHLMLPEPDGTLRLAFSRPISIGKAGYGKEVEGDNRTPVGFYRVTSFLTDEELIDKYGIGAFPINYPNRWDRLQNRTGYGIWIHGLPKAVDQRPLLDSEGCVVIDNQALEWLMEYLVPGQTRVMLGDQIDWTSPEQVESMRSGFRETFDDWLSAWTAIDNDRYLGHYADDFHSDDRNLEQWVAYKERIHAAKNWIEVEASDLGIYQYPGEPDLIVTEFYQTYRSSNFNANGSKQLFWRRQPDGSWKIIYEGAG